MDIITTVVLYQSDFSNQINKNNKIMKTCNIITNPLKNFYKNESNVNRSSLLIAHNIFSNLF